MTTAHNIRHIGLAQMSGQHLSEAPNEPMPTGREPELLQDCDKRLSKWLSNTPGARRIVREVAAEIAASPTPQQEKTE